MKPNFILIKFKDKNKINSSKILELFKLSAGNSITNLEYSLILKENTGGSK